MAATTFSFRQGDSYTIGIRLDANYDISGLQEIKVSLFGSTFPPDTTVDPRVFKIEISSDESAALNSAYYPLELFLDDANFGVKKFVLAIAYATPSATASNGSINTGYDLILDVKISDAPIEVVATVIALAKGEQGIQGIQGPPGVDGGISDGDKIDVVVSGGGANWAIKALSVTLAKISTAAYASINTINTLVFRDSTGSFAATNINLSSVTIPNIGVITGSQLTTSSTTPNQVVDSFDITLFRTAKYTIQIDGGGLSYSTEAMVTHDGSVVSRSFYGGTSDAPSEVSNTPLGHLDFDINGNNLRLLVSPVYGSSKIKIFRTTISI
jgi:hypothetical protein